MENKIILDYLEIETEFPVYEVINRCIVDSVLSQLPMDGATQQEDQEIHTLRLPKTRHKTLAFFNKIFNRPFHWTPWEKVAANHKYLFKNGGMLNILVRKNITKDTNLIYLTTADEMLELQKMGLTKSQALTSIAIETVGKYKSIVAEREISSQIITNKTDLKLIIVDTLQRHAKFLQPIERLINTDAIKENSHENTKTIFNDYILRLKKELALWQTFNLARPQNSVSKDIVKRIKDELNIEASALVAFLSYDDEYFITREKKIKEQIKAAEKFISDNIDKKTSKQINENLQGFLREQLNNLIHNAQAENDQITHNSDDSLLRGKLRDCLMEADKAVCYYIFDQHNPITKQHQLDFRTDQKGGAAPAVYHSRIHVGHSNKDLERALRGISILSSDTENPLVDTNFEIKKVKSASWNNFSTHTKGQKLRRFGAWALTTLVHFPLSIANMTVAALTNRAPISRLMRFLEKKIKTWFKIEEYYEHDFFKFQAKLGANNVYTSTSLGKMLNKAVREITGVILQSPQEIYNKAVKQFKLFKKDLKTGVWGSIYNKYKKKKEKKPTAQDKLDSLFTDEKFKSRLDALIAQAEKKNQLIQIRFKPLQFAKPTYPLEPYNPHDILSSVIAGLEGFMNFFKDDIFEKHPVTALIATIAYVIGGVAVLSPVTLSLVLTKIGLTSSQITQIISASSQIGKALAHGTESEAIAAGFTLAKMVGVSVNTLNQGFDSALFEFIDAVRKDPLIYSMGLAIAYGFGHMITDVVHVPALTDYLREEVGSVPALAKILIGAKLGVISLESALPEDEKHKSILAHFIGDIANIILLSLRLVASIGTLSLQPWKDLSQSCIRGLGILGHSINRILVLTVQHLTQIPKTLIEGGTTIAINVLKLVNIFTRPLRKKYDHSVIGVGPLLRTKEKIFHYGYQAGFFVRENISRKAERLYGGYITALNHKDPPEDQNSTTKILTKLNAWQEEQKHVVKAADPDIHLALPVEVEHEKRQQDEKKMVENVYYQQPSNNAQTLYANA